MVLRYLPWAIGGGLCVSAAPGTALWLLPAVGAVGHMLYDSDPDGWQERGQQLLQAPLPAWTWQLPGVTPPADGRRASRSSDRTERNGQADDHPAERPADETVQQRLTSEPHRLVIGGTRGGKSTLLHDLATTWAADGTRVLVLDPDAAPGQWPGCQAIGGGDDYAAMEPAVQAVAALVATRRTQRSAGQRRFAPFHLVIDECQDVFAEVDGARAVMETLARRGAKLGMHLTLGVQDRQVNTLGLDRKSHLLHNFVVAEVVRTRDGQRVARIAEPGSPQRHTYAIPPLRDPETLIVTAPRQRPAAQVATPTVATTAATAAQATTAATASTDATLLAALLAQVPTPGSLPKSVPAGPAAVPHARGSVAGSPTGTTASAATGTSGATPPPRGPGRGRRRSTAGSGSRKPRRAKWKEVDRKVAECVEAGLSANETHRALGGKRTDMLRRYREIKAALGPPARDVSAGSAG